MKYDSGMPSCSARTHDRQRGQPVVVRTHRTLVRPVEAHRPAPPVAVRPVVEAVSAPLVVRLPGRDRCDQRDRARRRRRRHDVRDLGLEAGPGPQLDDVVAGLPAGGVDGQVLAPGGDHGPGLGGREDGVGAAADPAAAPTARPRLPPPTPVGADPVRRHPVGRRRTSRPSRPTWVPGGPLLTVVNASIRPSAGCRMRQSPVPFSAPAGRAVPGSAESVARGPAGSRRTLRGADVLADASTDRLPRPAASRHEQAGHRCHRRRHRRRRHSHRSHLPRGGGPSATADDTSPRGCPGA